jgi:hypothetical protein
MRFDYVPYEGNWLPLVPVIFQYKKRRLPPVRALADTGATQTILPLEIATHLGIQVDLEDRIETQVAGGGQCFTYPSPVPLDYVIRDPASHMQYQWHGLVLFTLDQRLVLLGHHQCLEKFDVTFKGPEKFLELTPRFLTESVGRPRRRK